MGSDWNDGDRVYPTPRGVEIARAEMARQAAAAAGASPAWTDAQLQGTVAEAAFARAGEATMTAQLAREDADRALGDSKLALDASARAVALALRADVVAVVNLACLALVIILVVVLS